MQTDDLIAQLAERNARDGESFVLPLWLAALFAPVIGFAGFMALLGPRPDFLASLSTLRFDMKFVEAGLLAIAALGLLAALARPARPWRSRARMLLVPAAVLSAAVMVELVVVPADLWGAQAFTANAWTCLVAIPAIGAPVLALFVVALSQQAPTRPGLAGGVAGLAAAGVSAVFYAAHCPSDSPLFVALWYPLATLILVAGGAVAGRMFLRW
ncbi:NrsF family protein [Jiella mangrovi]|uniref:DUF1109 family protein n=1 Tax=Jiella mangrovi TaxID=2821407 RepID=A0ABS4BI02_9HYPH|nr:NrsF family protein [Jiella mangrovi]MBP0616392.1 DUF1109 family protein [Jiella mangrovi]